MGSPGSFGRKRSFISLNSSASIENLSRSERARARARANHAINDAQKGCAMQLNGITLRFIFRAFFKRKNNNGRFRITCNFLSNITVRNYEFIELKAVLK